MCAWGDLRWGSNYQFSQIYFFLFLHLFVCFDPRVAMCVFVSLIVFLLHVFVCFVGNEVDARVAMCVWGDLRWGSICQFSLADTTCQFLATDLHLRPTQIDTLTFKQEQASTLKRIKCSAFWS